MNIEAKLLEKSPTQDVSSSFKKREFVVEYAENPQYPEFLKFELIQGNCQLLDDFEPGDLLNISFNLKGRKWTDQKGVVKYFNSLQAWRLERASQSGAGEAQPPSDQWLQDDFSSDNELPF